MTKRQAEIIDESIKLIADKGIQAVITGNIGPKAYQVLSAAGIQMLTGVVGKIRDAIEAYKSGRLPTSTQPGMGMGMGMGRGMGRGMGGGPGLVRGMGPGQRPMPQTGPVRQVSREEEVTTLKSRAQMLAEELAEIQRRIKELEKKEQEKSK